jgi:hypothetical protein
VDRFIHSVVAFAVVLATAVPAFADPLADHVAASEQPALSAPASSPLPDAAPSTDSHDTAPVGFGWG